MKNKDPQHKDFEKRLKRIDKSVRKAQRAKPMKRTGAMDIKEEQRRKAQRKTISWSGVFKTLILLWILFIGLKTFMANQMGRAEYEARVSTLRQGTTAERFLSYALERGAIMGYVERFVSQAQEAIDEAPAAAPETPSEADATDAPSDDAASKNATPEASAN